MENQRHKLSEYDETIRFVLESGGEFRLYPRGTSMLPLLVQERDSVVLKKISEKPKRGDIFLYRRDNGAFVLHRMVGKDDMGYIFCGDNQLTLEHGITDSHLIGVVVRLYRGEKCIKLSSPAYRLYVFLWRSTFIRKVFFKLRRWKNKLTNDR